MRVLSAFCVLLFSGPGIGQALSPDQEILRAAGLPPDGPGLLAHFRKLTADEDQAIRDIVAKLSDASFAVREKATLDAIAKGYRAVPALRRAGRGGDLETQKRVSRCIAGIQNSPEGAQLAAAARVVQAQKTPGATRVLLAFFPNAENPALAQAVFNAVLTLDRGDAIEALPALRAALEDGHVPVRQRALRAVGYLGPEAADAVPLIAVCLRQGHREVRLAGLTALEQMGALAQNGVAALGDLIRDPDPEVRDRATKLAGRFGPEGQKAVAALYDRLLDPEDKERLHAAQALGNMGGRAVPVLLEALAKGDGNARSFALAALARCGRDDPVVIRKAAEAVADVENIYADVSAYRFGPEAAKLLAAALEHDNPRVRERAARALASFGPLGKPAVAALTARLKDEDRRVRGYAAQALWRIERQPELVAPVLIEAFQREDKKYRRSQILHETLIHLEPRPDAVVTLLLAALEDAEGPVRRTAAQALASEPTRTGEVVAGLLKALGDKDKLVRAAAATSLGWQGARSQGARSQGARAPDVVPALSAVFRNADSGAGREALWSLPRIGGAAKAALPAAIEALNDRLLSDAAADFIASLGPDGKSAAIALARRDTPAAFRALAALGPEARDAVPLLVKMHSSTPGMPQVFAAIGPPALEPLMEALGGPDPALSYNAGHYLGELGPKAVPALVKHFSDRGARGRWWAALALGRIGAEARAALPALIAATKEADPVLRRGATRAIGQIGPQHPEVVPTLVAMLKDSETRAEAITSLGQAGPKAEEALPALLTHVSGQSYVGVMAAAAVLKIDARNAAARAALHEAIKAPDAQRRHQALQVLRDIDEGGPEVIAACVATVKEADVTRHRQAIAYLGRLAEKDDAALKALIDALDLRVPPEADVKKSALAALTSLGSKAKSAVPRVIPLLDHRFWDVRAGAAKALAAVGWETPAALPVLVARVQMHDGLHRPPEFAEALHKMGGATHLVVDELTHIVMSDRHSPQDRLKAVALLTSLGPRAKSALPQLIFMANSLGGYDSGHFTIRPYAAYGLWKLGLTDEAVYALLLPLKEPLGHENKLVAIGFLGEIGPAARAAVPALRFASRCEDARVRAAAASAIAAISAQPNDRR
jgi:HEAT repeat protein